MSIIHSELAKGRWYQLSLLDQLGNIGSDVARAVRWKNQDEHEEFEAAFARALDLFDLTLSDKRWKGRRKEICRSREVLCDYFSDNEYGSNDESLQQYFDDFAFAAREEHYAKQKN